MTDALRSCLCNFDQPAIIFHTSGGQAREILSSTPSHNRLRGRAPAKADRAAWSRSRCRSQPTGLGLGVYEDAIDYNVFSGEWCIGRI
jgi:hypothetical protein